jgi:dTDP-4-dehydrorhamnose reductase
MKAVRPSFSVLDKSRTVEVLGRELPHWRSNLRLMIKEVQALG